ncbi:MAG: exo-alpha-sialidase [Clostridiales bacterium]|nr:exo-alpha-sialidase [Clostridiales bacterium]
MSDATPIFHKKTGKILLLGHYATYTDKNAPSAGKPRHTTYAVYDEKLGDFTPFELLQMPKDSKQTYYNCGNGSGQSSELESGELLIPVYYMDKEQAGLAWGTNCYNSSVMRCSFDGSKLNFLEIGNSLTVGVPRGLGEPSVIKHNDEYFLALRNDKSGYVTKSKDGLLYDEQKELVFDNCENVGNYCTQQRWITCGGKLYMVYTRKNANNDHVFRHRAPLFMAEFDAERMCLIKDTEQVVVPNRGARLGNFGCQSLEDGKTAFVFASEWMQPEGCEKYGSDNSIFVVKISV